MDGGPYLGVRAFDFASPENHNAHSPRIGLAEVRLNGGLFHCTAQFCEAWQRERLSPRETGFHTGRINGSDLESGSSRRIGFLDVRSARKSSV
jgi:hypothetical protein